MGHDSVVCCSHIRIVMGSDIYAPANSGIQKVRVVTTEFGKFVWQKLYTVPFCRKERDTSNCLFEIPR